MMNLTSLTEAGGETVERDCCKRQWDRHLACQLLHISEETGQAGSLSHYIGGLLRRFLITVEGFFAEVLMKGVKEKFSRPCGTWFVRWFYPALKRRAIVDCPSGTVSGGGCGWFLDVCLNIAARAERRALPACFQASSRLLLKFTTGK
jgi:hypothetical protein